MRIVSAQELESWLASGEVLEQDGRGAKVIRLGDEQILKIFRPRRRLWLSRLRPQALRFKRNAEQLLASGITAPHVIECFWLDKARAISCCLYTPIPGRSLAQIYRNSLSEFNLLLAKFAEFIYLLHQRGIYFRSLHLGNVLILPNGTFGLIDFLDIKFKRTPLNPWLVKRNLDHLRSYLQRNQVNDFPWEDLQTAYNKIKQN
ncbi:toluene tolerance protein [Stutzerimonas kunmingensis]|uniref:toluene tolerance protein n=1 Tax=Stutzerimonas kunmingensis TaxID=1211807 RepID=UPI0028AE7E9D|nr:toluene tolerance protein [Stutzerimonas kunmingensis]